MTDETKKVVSIDGTDYSPEDLSEEAIVCINHLQDLNQKKARLRAEVDQITAAESVFMSKLKESLPESESEAGGAN